MARVHRLSMQILIENCVVGRGRASVSTVLAPQTLKERKIEVLSYFHDSLVLHTLAQQNRSVVCRLVESCARGERTG